MKQKITDKPLKPQINLQSKNFKHRVNPIRKYGNSKLKKFFVRLTEKSYFINFKVKFPRFMLKMFSTLFKLFEVLIFSLLILFVLKIFMELKLTWMNYFCSVALYFIIVEVKDFILYLYGGGK